MKNLIDKLKNAGTKTAFALALPFLISGCNKNEQDIYKDEKEINLDQNENPKIISSPILEINEHGEYDYRPKTSGSYGDKLTFSLVESPEWLDFYPTLNSVYGNAPEVLEDKNVSIRLKILDGKGRMDEQAYSLKIKNIYNVHNLDEEEIGNLSSVKEGVINFSEPVNFSKEDIILSGISDKTPHGLFRKIKNITNDNTELQTYSEPPTLEEAIKEDSFSFERKLSPSNARLSGSVKGYSGRITDTGFNIDLDNVVLAGPNGNLTADGNISFDFEPVFEGKFNKKLENLKFQIRINETTDLTLSSEIYSFSFENETTVARYDFPPISVPTAAGLPLIITPKLDVVVGARGRVASDLETRVKQEANLSPGIIYEKGSWSVMEEFSNRFDFSSPNLENDLEVQVYAGPQLKFLVYEFLPGPQAGISTTLKLEAASTNDWTLSGGLQAYAGIDMGAFSKAIPDYNRNIISFEKILLESTEVNTKPDAYFVWSPTSGTTETTFSFNSSGSYDAEDGLNLQYRWDWETDGNWDTEFTYNKITSHNFSSPGTHKVSLQAKDSQGATDELPLNVLVEGDNPGGGLEGKIYFVSNKFNGLDYDIWSIDPDGSRRSRITTGEAWDVGINLMKTKDKIAFLSRPKFGQGSLEVHSINFDGTGRKQLTYSGEKEGISSSPNGSNLAYIAGKNMYILDVESSSSKRILSVEGDYLGGVSWSPKGNEILFSLRTEEGSWDIHKTNSYGDSPEQWTFNSDSKYPSWSPNGNEIAYTFGNDLYVMDYGGINSRQLTQTPGRESSPSWSPDGTKIVYNYGEDYLTGDIYFINSDGTGKTPVTSNDANDANPIWVYE